MLQFFITSLPATVDVLLLEGFYLYTSTPLLPLLTVNIFVDCDADVREVDKGWMLEVELVADGVAGYLRPAGRLGLGEKGKRLVLVERARVTIMMRFRGCHGVSRCRIEESFLDV